MNGKKSLVVAGLLLGILMAAMDNTIVATAMSTIISDIGGFDKFVWVTTAYMVTMMSGTPIFGKLSDMYGRKRFFLIGLGLFLVGSILCGTATTITQLSIYRAIQGLGGGAIMPIAFTIVFDIFPPEQRGKMGGLFGAVFGLSSILGPLLGAYITDFINWRWVFYVNLPLGMLSIIFVILFYHESLEHREQKIDWWGAITLVVSVISLMFALELGGNKFAWSSPFILSLFAAFALFFFVFILIEKRASDPIIAFRMFKQKLFAYSNGAALFIGASYIVAIVYIPIFIQGVNGGSAKSAGLILMPMMLGSVFGSQLGGFLTTKLSYRNIMILSSVFFLPGIFLLSTLTPETSRGIITIFMILTGFGAGFSFSVLSMAAIHDFGMRERGSATSANRFFISLGMTLGISIFGIIQRNLFTSNLTGKFGKIGDAQMLLSPEGRTNIPSEVLNRIVEFMSSSIADTFMWAMIPASISLLFIMLFPNKKILLK